MVARHSVDELAHDSMWPAPRPVSSIAWMVAPLSKGTPIPDRGMSGIIATLRV
jgi:hypothetical protein